MVMIQAHEFSARAQAAGMNIDEMCSRAGVQRAVFDAWRNGEAVDASVPRSLARVVENAERGGDRPNVPVSKDARIAEISRCREILGWGLPTLATKLGIPLPAALKINVGKTDVSDADIDYMQRLVAAVEAVPRTRPMVEATTEPVEDEDMALREAVIDEAVAVYLETPAEGDEGAGARWAIGQVLARLGLLGEARVLLNQRQTERAGDPPDVQLPDDGVIGRVPFRSTEAPAPGPV